jgi:hypothetical protein
MFVKSHATTLSIRALNVPLFCCIFIFARLIVVPRGQGDYIALERHAISDLCCLKTQGEYPLDSQHRETLKPKMDRRRRQLENYSTQIYHPCAESLQDPHKGLHDRSTKEPYSAMSESYNWWDNTADNRNGISSKNSCIQYQLSPIYTVADIN